MLACNAIHILSKWFLENLCLFEVPSITTQFCVFPKVQELYRGNVVKGRRVSLIFGLKLIL